MDLSGRIGQRCQKAVQAEHDHKQDSLKHGSSPSLPYYAARSHLDRQVPSRFDACHRMRNHVIILFSTVIEEKNERKAFEIGPNAHFYLDENVVWDLHFIIFFDICSMFLVNSISCPVEDGTAAPGNPVHPILYNRPDNRCPGNSPHSCSSMSPISDLV